jgi:hypothetical protein
VTGMNVRRRDGRTDPESEDKKMAFFVGLLLFVVIVGRLDARLPWPRPGDPEVRS